MSNDFRGEVYAEHQFYLALTVTIASTHFAYTRGMARLSWPSGEIVDRIEQVTRR